jgi:hypothetical protein
MCLCVRALTCGYDRVESDLSEVATHAPSFQYPPGPGGINERREKKKCKGCRGNVDRAISS